MLAYGSEAGSAAPSQTSPDPYQLIADVNALRAANGLPALNPDPILMSVSQQHADYMASIGTVTHSGPDGSRPYQRSLAAGYPVAGDLSQGGFHSENIIAGKNMTPAEAVSWWTGDAPHLNTMLSPNFTDIGAGVAVSGDTVYYEINTSRKSGVPAPAYTPQSLNGTPVYNLGPLASTIFPSTPLPDGSILHVVKPGETLWLIAITYGIKINDILTLNNIAKDSPIYPGQQLVIRQASATQTLTPSASMTLPPAPSSTAPLPGSPAKSPTSSPPTAEPDIQGRGGGGNRFTLLVIVLAALVIAGLAAFAGGRRMRA